jgi:hypothetical protein
MNLHHLGTVDHLRPDGGSRSAVDRCTDGSSESKEVVGLGCHASTCIRWKVPMSCEPWGRGTDARPQRGSPALYVNRNLLYQHDRIVLLWRTVEQTITRKQSRTLGSRQHKPLKSFVRMPVREKTRTACSGPRGSSRRQHLAVPE